MGSDPGSSQAAGAEGAGLAALCFPISSEFCLSPDPPGFKPALGCVIWVLAALSPPRASPAPSQHPHGWEGEAWRDSCLNLPLPAVVCALQPRALPAGPDSPPRSPAGDTGKGHWGQPGDMGSSCPEPRSAGMEVGKDKWRV